MSNRIEWLREQITRFEVLKQKALYKERVQEIIDVYEEELQKLEPNNLKNWLK